MNWISIEDKKPPCGKWILFTSGHSYWVNSLPVAGMSDDRYLSNVKAWAELEPFTEKYAVIIKYNVYAASKEAAIEAVRQLIREG